VVNTICALIVKDRSKAIGASQLAFDRRLFLRPEFCAFQLWGVFSMLGEYHPLPRPLMAGEVITSLIAPLTASLLARIRRLEFQVRQ